MTEITCNDPKTPYALRLPQSPMREPVLRPFPKTTAPHPIHIIYIAAAHFLRIRSKLHIAYILQNVNA